MDFVDQLRVLATHVAQLFRYFHVTEARFSVLTNGIHYKLFTDLQQPNKMDSKPFFEFNFADFRERDVEELKRIPKAAFDVDTVTLRPTLVGHDRAS
ncbi:hypothetical protein [Quisquiliibacterium transsilvanicum]|uniref:Uncharacterized protein n=1 Tax=Quisquiliibacterium transsilvanicum TaxID=1549638 RepID=A0A7W8HG70_9BURK|nr:hypothetical protein [Quisquiliibacterium transsilvanicum]MBB5271479.1 hypothetical protein [Quisquiliibacterium transsilvanicum]